MAKIAPNNLFKIPDFNAISLVCLLSVTGGCLLICSSDLLSVYLSIELQSFSVYVLAAIFKHRLSATSAGLKYYLLGGLSSAFILLGCSVIYSSTGITNLETIITFLSTFNKSNIILFVGMCLIGVGLFFKVSAAPFHQWAPDVYDGVPTVITSWLTVIPKISFLTILLYFNLLGEVSTFIVEANPWHALLLFGSIFSLIIGTWLGLVQVKVKRLLAYSTISHIGFILLALGIHSVDSIEALLLYLFQYTITNSAVFLILLALGQTPLRSTLHTDESDDFSNHHTLNKFNSTIDLERLTDLQGIFGRSPMLALSFCVCLFSIAGTPPLVGFFGKYFVLLSSIKNGFYFISIVAILASVISASYYLKLISLIFFISPSTKAHSPKPILLSTHLPPLYNHSLNISVPLVTHTTQNKQYISEQYIDNATSTNSYFISVFSLISCLFVLEPTLVLTSINYSCLTWLSV